MALTPAQRAKRWRKTHPAKAKIVRKNQYKRERGMPNYKAQRNKLNMAYNLRVKLEVLAHYGPNGILRCSWSGCLVDDVDMLSLDHVLNDGAEFRKRNNRLAGTSLYTNLRAREFPSGFQTLCHNHQWKKELLRRREGLDAETHFVRSGRAKTHS